jgi:hypothetical protein
MSVRNRRKGRSQKGRKGKHIEESGEKEFLNLSSYFYHLNVTDLTRKDKNIAFQARMLQ